MESQQPAPAFAIADPNILSALGLQQILTNMVPTINIRIFTTFRELEAAEEQFAHYFVASRIYFEHLPYFQAHPRRTIVLVGGYLQIQGVPTLNVCQSEKMIVKSIMTLHRQGHPHACHQPRTDTAHSPLSLREVEVTILLTKGHTNKEIADRLNISLTTVMTHRRNIKEKLHARSLTDIITYAVMNGIVSLDEL